MHSHEQSNKQFNDLVIVTGVSGSGKDFLLSRALQTLPLTAQVTLCSFGTALHELVLATGLEGYETRDDLHKLSAGLVREFGQQVLQAILAIEGTKILNTHVAYREGQLVVSDPVTDLDLGARAYIFVHADPKVIAARRAQDPERTRTTESSTVIGLHQEIALSTVQAIVGVTAATLTVLHNTHENTAANVEAMREVIEQSQ